MSDVDTEPLPLEFVQLPRPILTAISTNASRYLVQRVHGIFTTDMTSIQILLGDGVDSNTSNLIVRCLITSCDRQFTAVTMSDAIYDCVHSMGYTALLPYLRSNMECVAQYILNNSPHLTLNNQIICAYGVQTIEVIGS